MKKFNLQLFAEGEPTGEPNQGQPNEPTGNPEPKTFTQDEVDAIIEKRLARANEKSAKEAQKLVEEALAKKEKEDEALRYAQMNEEEKKKAENEALLKRVAELENKEALSNMSKAARSQLSEKEITIPDELVAMLVDKDADITRTRVDQFVDLFKKSVAEEIKNKYKSETPKTGSTSKLTKEEILAIKDAVERQKKIDENLELFKN